MERICANCGAKSDEDTSFCTKCGVQYLTPEGQQFKIANEHLKSHSPAKATPTQVRYVQKPVNFFQLLSALIFIFGLGLVGYSVYLFSIAGQPTPTANQTSTPIIVSASQIIGDYANNEVSADQKYKNYYLEISGIVQSINKDLFNDPYIVIAPNKQTFNGIECSFNQDQEGELANLNAGQSITVEGIGNGYVLNSVMVKNCSIIQNSSSSQ